MSVFHIDYTTFSVLAHQGNPKKKKMFFRGLSTDQGLATSRKGGGGGGVCFADADTCLYLSTHPFMLEQKHIT